MNWSPLTASRPYNWPLDGDWSAGDTALIVIDMQNDFLNPNGYFGQMGYSLEHTRAAIKPTQSLLSAARQQGLPIIYTLESHLPDLADLNPTKQARAEAIGTPIGQSGPMGRFLVQGEPGSQVVPELAPASSDIILHKPGNGAYHATDLDQILRAKGIRHLLICGVTTDVCVHSTLREANDRGYDCLVVSDCCGAGDPLLHDAALNMMLNEGGIFGAISDHQSLVRHWATCDQEAYQ